MSRKSVLYNYCDQPDGRVEEIITALHCIRGCDKPKQSGKQVVEIYADEVVIARDVSRLPFFLYHGYFHACFHRQGDERDMVIVCDHRAAVRAEAEDLLKDVWSNIAHREKRPDKKHLVEKRMVGDLNNHTFFLREAERLGVFKLISGPARVVALYAPADKEHPCNQLVIQLHNAEAVFNRAADYERFMVGGKKICCKQYGGELILYAVPSAATQRREP